MHKNIGSVLCAATLFVSNICALDNLKSKAQTVITIIKDKLQGTPSGNAIKKAENIASNITNSVPAQTLFKTQIWQTAASVANICKNSAESQIQEKASSTLGNIGPLFANGLIKMNNEMQALKDNLSLQIQYIDQEMKIIQSSQVESLTSNIGAENDLQVSSEIVDETADATIQTSNSAITSQNSQIPSYISQNTPTNQETTDTNYSIATPSISLADTTKARKIALMALKQQYSSALVSLLQLETSTSAVISNISRGSFDIGQIQTLIREAPSSISAIKQSLLGTPCEAFATNLEASLNIVDNCAADIIKQQSAQLEKAT
ncbi:MAG: hypothetical protein LBS23_03305 [Holosporaceae bacterium]|jgi:hypothetical protein|nr:hypothetical protein [Holosporaceae bacterium]